MLKRTSGGLKSQKLLYDSDIIFYIEGKKENKNEGDVKTYDEIYYEMLSQHFLPGRKVKIKVAGSCNDVIDIHHDVVKANDLSTICFIDRDYHGVNFSRIRDFRLVKTYGYSWENDFWTFNLSVEIIKMFTLSSQACVNEFNVIIRNATKRLFYLHSLNIASSYYGLRLFKLGAKGEGMALVSNPLVLMASAR